ncbi:hypothetical protein BVY03_02660 [bacterium K02(2017)]|nr:hypothetical protein BVY03_02660 [bacterium K02(2017)]
MARTAQSLLLTSKNKQELEFLIKNSSNTRLKNRFNIILLASQNHSNIVISKKLNISPVQVGKWRRRYIKFGVEGLKDRDRDGRPMIYNVQQRDLIVRNLLDLLLDDKELSIRKAAKILKINFMLLFRILKEIGLNIKDVDGWLRQRGSDFIPKQVEVVALYINPPENALVLKVGYDKKESLSKGDNSMGLKFAKANSLLAKFMFDSKKRKKPFIKKHIDQNFVGFIKQVQKKYGEKCEYRLITENLSVHLNEDLKNWQKEFSQNKINLSVLHSFWLQQVEIWLSVLADQSQDRVIFKTSTEYSLQIMNYVNEYTESGRSFSWISR